MKWRLFQRQRAERFAQLLDEANGGRRHHVRSRVDADLTGPLAVAQQLSAERPEVDLDPDFRAGLRAMLLAAAPEELATPAEAAQPTPVEPARPAVPRDARSRLRARGAIVVGVIFGAVAVSGMSAASENAVPGDALYGVKRSTERAQLALASSELSRGQLFLDFARTRLAEAAVVRRDSTGFSAALNDMDSDTRHGIRLLTMSAVDRGDSAALDVIAMFLLKQRRQMAGLLEAASHTERARAAKSLGLLEAIKLRADQLRTAMLCGAETKAQTDALGPVPAACTTGRESIGGPLEDPPPARTGSGRITDVPRADRTEPAEQPSIGTPPSPTSPAAKSRTSDRSGRTE